MSHFPKNHQLRPLYRAAGAAAGFYCILFGAVGLGKGVGQGLFSRGSSWALGLKTNEAFAIVSIIVGAVVVGAAVIGHNVDRVVDMVLGPVFIGTGLAMMGLMETDANFLNFGMSTCIVSFVIGLVLMAAGFYAEVAPAEVAVAEENFRRSAPDPESALRPHP